MLGETAKLAVNLTFGSNAGTVLGKVSKDLKGIDSDIAKATKGMSGIGKGAYTVGAGIGTAIKRGAILATAAVGTLTAFLALSVKEGQDAVKVQTILSTAIANSGKVSAAQVTVLNDQSTALMHLAGIDDELIKTEQTRLITMGLTGDAVAKLTPLILDASKATGKDLLTVTIAAGKAANGQATALSRLGIQVDKTKFKIDPLAETIRVLNERFGGTTKALSGGLDARLGDLRQSLANIREDIGIKLLPALTRIVDVVGKALVPAFGKFVDRILPDISKGIDTFASALEGGGAEKAINGIADALGSMISLLKIAAEPVKTIVSAFLSLPKEVQGILVGGFAINKLSGGLIGQGLGQIAGGLLQRGGTPANPVFVSDVTGGLGGGLAGKAAGGIGLAGVGAAAGIVAAGAITSWVAANGLRDTRNAIASASGLTNTQALAVQLSQMDPANRQMALMHGAQAEFARAGTTYAKALGEATGAIEKFGAATTIVGSSWANAHGTALVATPDATSLSGRLATALKSTKLSVNAAEMATPLISAFMQSVSPSQRSMASAMEQLKGMQAKYLAQGDTVLAASIGRDIAMLNQTIIDKKFTAAMSIVGSDWYNQPKPKPTPAKSKETPIVGSDWYKPTVVVNTGVTVRDVVTKTKTSNSLGPIRKIGG